MHFEQEQALSIPHLLASCAGAGDQQGAAAFDLMVSRTHWWDLQGNTRNKYRDEHSICYVSSPSFEMGPESSLERQNPKLGGRVGTGELGFAEVAVPPLSPPAPGLKDLRLSPSRAQNLPATCVPAHWELSYSQGS